MNKFEDIVNHYKKSILDGGRKNIEISFSNDCIFFYREGISYHTKRISINDLLSPESGFLQAVFGTDWSEMYRKDYYEDNVNAFEDIYDNENGILTLPRWKFHAMKLSILSQEEKIKYLEDNVIIE